MRFKIIGNLLLVLALCLTVLPKAHAQTVATDPPKSKFLGLQIGRADLISGIAFVDSLLKFKQIPGSKGLPLLTAKSPKGEHVEITGTENNITKAQWTAVLTSNTANNKEATNMLAFFTNTVVGQEGANWLFQQLFLYNQTPTTPINANTLVNTTRLMFVYDPIKKTLSVTALTQ
jgi:hypothetical protein